MHSSIPAKLKYCAALSVLLATATPVASVNAATCKGKQEIERQIGSMIVVGFLGNSPKAKWFGHVADQLEAGKISGVLFFGRNIRSKASVRQLTKMLVARAPRNKLPIIAIDQEGGRIQRLNRSMRFRETPSAKVVARTMNTAQAKRVYGKMAADLASWGFTLNLAPVVDVDVNPNNPIIGKLQRSYSSDPNIVARYASAFVQAHRSKGVLTALKHFPGHGSSLADSHKQFVDVTKTWVPKELVPYQKMIAHNNVDMIMTGHLRNGKLQSPKDRLPVSLSDNVIEQQLRRKLGYSGAIISDDLQMKAISDNYDFETAVVRAVRAGNDILLFANDKRPVLRVPEQVIKILTSAACKDSKIRSRIVASSLRINKLRRKMTALRNGTQATTRSIKKRMVAFMTPKRMSGMLRPKMLYVSSKKL